VDVQTFYDRFPYPPPAGDLDRYRLKWQDDARRRAEFHLFWPARPFREDFSILIAGCGTEQAARHAIRWPKAHVIAIDISETALAYEAKLKRTLGLDNLDLYQLPVEHAADLGLCFDQVISTGVLHHLMDPDAGLRALGAVLAPEGAMHLMLYAPYGRRGVYMLQEFFRRAGIAANPDGVREAFQVLGHLPQDHPLAHLLRSVQDFSNESGFADALLHPLDRAYSVPQLFMFLEANGMEFGRWLRQAPYSLRAGVMAQIAHAARLSTLPPEDQYAQAELFRGTMLHHSLIAHRADQARSGDIDFSGKAWLGYIPIRLADTVMIEERLPPGAAAVLINRSHTNTDLVLPLDVQSKRLFEAIDGKLSIAEILRGTPHANLARVAQLFETLFWFDQIVFDASH
jgi:SAM-dependent methyltransferase